jgi:hypothetical protein
MAAKPQEDFFKSRSLTFGTFIDRDEFLHPEQDHPGDSCTETQYFGFYVPEANIYGFCYFWLHPNLDTVMSGLFACQGFKRQHLQAELFDFYQNMSRKTVITNDLRSFKLPNSYQVDVITPGKQMRMRYDDPVRQNRLDLRISAAGPVAMRANNKHFEQTMRYQGELLLRGESFKVDCCNVRDRSWGELRPEQTLSFPPLTWTTGYFGEELSFNCSAFDHPDFNPPSLGEFPIAAEQAFNDGWVVRDGRLIKLRSIRKLTQRDPQIGRPVSHIIHAVDVEERAYEIKGTVTAGLPFAFWPNVYTHLGMTRWEWDGKVGWGDTQECHWTDYIQKFVK